MPTFPFAVDGNHGRRFDHRFSRGGTVFSLVARRLRETLRKDHDNSEPLDRTGAEVREDALAPGCGEAAKLNQDDSLGS